MLLIAQKKEVSSPVRRIGAVKSPRAQAAARRARRDALVLEHLPLARNIAGRLRESLPAHVELDDIIHAGLLGLIDAASRFDTGKNATFSGYAKHRIRGAILDSLREQDCASRDLRKRDRQMQEAARQLTAELGRTPSDMEVANRLGIDVQRCRELLANLQRCSAASARSGNDNEEVCPVQDCAAGPESGPHHVAAGRQRRAILSEAMQSLPERYRAVVSLYYNRELTMREIGAELGINESRVSQIHKAALAKMNTALTQAGVLSAADL